MKNLLVTLSLLALPLASAQAAAKMASYKVDTTSSTAEWEGSKLGGSHHGELKLKSGTLTVAQGALTGGEVIIDMTTLKNFDQTGEYNTKLVNHLKSDDFFSIEKFPTSTLKITKVEPQGDKVLITGDLTIKGVSNPVNFPATVKVDGNKLAANGVMTVDRTLYGIKFRSLKYFSAIGDKVINDKFSVKFDLKAQN